MAKQKAKTGDAAPQEVAEVASVTEKESVTPVTYETPVTYDLAELFWLLRQDGVPLERLIGSLPVITAETLRNFAENLSLPGDVFSRAQMKSEVKNEGSP